MTRNILVDFWYSIHQGGSSILAPRTSCGVIKIGCSCKRMGKFRQATLCIRELVANKDMGRGKDANENLLRFLDFCGLNGRLGPGDRRTTSRTNNIPGQVIESKNKGESNARTLDTKGPRRYLSPMERTSQTRRSHLQLRERLRL